MTYTFDTRTVPHADGGTVTLLQAAETRDGFHILLTRWTTYRGTVVYEVCRWSPALRSSVRLDQRPTEAAARRVANAWWTSERNHTATPHARRVA